MISVIICVRNGSVSIPKQLRALDTQVDAPEHEVIVCDNGSTDGTWNVVKAWMDAGNHLASRIRLVDGGAKPNIPQARNRASELAIGDIVAFCDADDVIDPNWIAQMAAHTPRGGMAGGRFLAVSPEGDPRTDTFPDGLNGHGFLPYAANGNMAIDRKLLEQLHGYDESLPAYGYEDVDLSWRAQISGRPLVYVRDATVRMTLSPPRQALRKKFLLGMGRVLMASRYPDYDSRSYTPTACLSQLAKWNVVVARSVISHQPTSVTRNSVSQAVASAGNLWGSVYYRIFGFPPARFAMKSQPTTTHMSTNA